MTMDESSGSHSPKQWVLLVVPRAVIVDDWQFDLPKIGESGTKTLQLTGPSFWWATGLSL